MGPIVMHRASLGARRAFAAAPSQTVVPRVRGDASHRFLPGNVRRLSTQVAALDEPQTADERSQQAVGQSAGAESVAEVRLEELDDAQEQLIAWMMYKDDEQQEADLDEMVDYDEFGDEEYAELYDEVEKLYAEVEYDFKVGDKVTGTVIDIDEDGAYVEIGAKASGFCPLSECSLAKLKTPWEVLRPGMKREFVVVEDENDYGEVILSLASAEAAVFWTRVRQLQEEDFSVNVTVIGVTKGGLLVKYGPVEGFVPMKQFGTSLNENFENMEGMIGKEIPVKFQEVDEEQQRLVFSNKRASATADYTGFKIGDVVTGTVQRVQPYGAFVDLGGVTGLLHVSQISHERVTSVDKILSVGDKLKVMILSQDKERGRVTLSTKKLEPAPGDMLKDPQMVFEKAEEMAATFRERISAAELAVRMEEPSIMEGSGSEMPVV